MIERIWDRMQEYNPKADKEKLWAGFAFAKEAHKDQVRKSGEPFFTHALTGHYRKP